MYLIIMISKHLESELADDAILSVVALACSIPMSTL